MIISYLINNILFFCSLSSRWYSLGPKHSLTVPSSIMLDKNAVDGTRLRYLCRFIRRALCRLLCIVPLEHHSTREAVGTSQPCISSTSRLLVTPSFIPKSSCCYRHLLGHRWPIQSNSGFIDSERVTSISIKVHHHSMCQCCCFNDYFLFIRVHNSPI